MRFANPLWFLLLIVVFAAWFLRHRFLYRSTIRFSDVESLKQIATKRTQYFSKLALVIRLLIFILIIVALARPQDVLIEKEVSSEGVDIMLVLDVSQSMAAEDFKPDNRLVVAKRTLLDFVQKRDSDRLGLVVFGADAYTQCPLTSDQAVLSHYLNEVELGMAGDGTAVGMAIATALNRMKNSLSKSKVMILLTDGENNRGEIDPETASQFARDMGIKIYTIGVGREGGAPIPYIDPVYGKVYSSQMTYLDEVTLKAIAKKTNGLYFRAFDSEGLTAIYDEINALEKTDIKTKHYRDYVDHFPIILMWIFILLMIEVCITNLILVIIP
jgi:Ca-activated chloride channel homolog